MSIISYIKNVKSTEDSDIRQLFSVADIVAAIQFWAPKFYPLFSHSIGPTNVQV